MAPEITPEARPTTILKHAFGIYDSLAMLAGMQLDLFTPLADRSMSPSELAQALGVRPEKLQPLLYALVRAELLAVKDGHFANTPEAETYLVRGRPTYMGSVHELYADLWGATLNTAQSIRTGVPQAKHDFSTMPDEELHAFFRGLHAGTVAAGHELTRTYDFGRFRRLLDVGGGSGGLAIAACQNCPELIGTVAELPRVAPITSSFIEEAGLTDRVSVLTADVVAHAPDGQFDVAVLRSFLQILSPEQARRALTHVGQALEPGGAIFIVGRVLHDSRLSPSETVAFNLVFLNIYDEGQAFTECEHRTWLTEAGFAEIEIGYDALPGGVSVITARKRG